MAFSPEDVVAIVKRHEPDFAPGEKVVYCDTNYIFLGMIIEKVTGKPVEDVIRGEILTPLGMAHTTFPTTSAMPEPFSHGYYAGEDGKGKLRDFTASNPAVAWSAGAMISTLDDLRIWSKALATGALLKPQTHAEQMKFGAIATKPIHVGYGSWGSPISADWSAIMARSSGSSAIRPRCSMCLPLTPRLSSRAIWLRTSRIQRQRSPMRSPSV